LPTKIPLSLFLDSLELSKFTRTSRLSSSGENGLKKSRTRSKKFSIILQFQKLTGKLSEAELEEDKLLSKNDCFKNNDLILITYLF